MRTMEAIGAVPCARLAFTEVIMVNHGALSMAPFLACSPSFSTHLPSPPPPPLLFPATPAPACPRGLTVNSYNSYMQDALIGNAMQCNACCCRLEDMLPDERSEEAALY